MSFPRLHTFIHSFIHTKHLISVLYCKRPWRCTAELNTDQTKVIKRSKSPNGETEVVLGTGELNLGQGTRGRLLQGVKFKLSS